MSFCYKHADRRTSGKRDIMTYIYPPLDKRYSPIISSICGPNNLVGILCRLSEEINKLVDTLYRLPNDINKLVAIHCTGI